MSEIGFTNSPGVSCDTETVSCDIPKDRPSKDLVAVEENIFLMFKNRCESISYFDGLMKLYLKEFFAGLFLFLHQRHIVHIADLKNSPLSATYIGKDKVFGKLLDDFIRLMFDAQIVLRDNDIKSSSFNNFKESIALKIDGFIDRCFLNFGKNPKAAFLITSIAKIFPRKVRALTMEQLLAFDVKRNGTHDNAVNVAINPDDATGRLVTKCTQAESFICDKNPWPKIINSGDKPVIKKGPALSQAVSDYVNTVVNDAVAPVIAAKIKAGEDLNGGAIFNEICGKVFIEKLQSDILELFGEICEEMDITVEVSLAIVLQLERAITPSDQDILPSNLVDRIKVLNAKLRYEVLIEGNRKVNGKKRPRFFSKFVDGVMEIINDPFIQASSSILQIELMVEFLEKLFENQTMDSINKSAGIKDLENRFFVLFGSLVSNLAISSRALGKLQRTKNLMQLLAHSVDSAKTYHDICKAALDDTELKADQVQRAFGKVDKVEKAEAALKIRLDECRKALIDHLQVIAQEPQKTNSDELAELMDSEKKLTLESGILERDKSNLLLAANKSESELPDLSNLASLLAGAERHLSGATTMRGSFIDALRTLADEFSIKS